MNHVHAILAASLLLTIGLLAFSALAEGNSVNSYGVPNTNTLAFGVTPEH
jgi:hypothetical protein